MGNKGVFSWYLAYFEDIISSQKKRVSIRNNGPFFPLFSRNRKKVFINLMWFPF